MQFIILTIILIYYLMRQANGNLKCFECKFVIFKLMTKKICHLTFLKYLRQNALTFFKIEHKILTCIKNKFTSPESRLTILKNNL